MSRYKKITWRDIIKWIVCIALIGLGVYLPTLPDPNKAFAITWGDKSFHIATVFIVVGIVPLVIPQIQALIDVYIKWKKAKDEKNGK